MGNTNVIQIKNLTKDYGNSKGVFDLSFEIPKGEVFGFLGPNGAGKTTTIRHLLGFLNSDSGECFIDGKDCRNNQAEIQRELGYLPGEIAFFDELSGTEFIKFIAKMRGMTDFTRMNQLIEMLELDTKGRLKKMSKGMKQKIGIVCAFMHNPSVLILDEPTSGLDPLMQSRFVELINQEKQAGKTILMSSHSFEEVERTCSRVGIIRSGKLVTIEEISALKSTQKKTYVITLNTESDALAFSKENLTVASIDKNDVTVSVKGDITPLITAMSKHSVTGIDVMTESLEELFMHYYGNERTENRNDK